MEGYEGLSYQEWRVLHKELDRVPEAHWGSYIIADAIRELAYAISQLKVQSGLWDVANAIESCIREGLDVTLKLGDRPIRIDLNDPISVQIETREEK